MKKKYFIFLVSLPCLVILTSFLFYHCYFGGYGISSVPSDWTNTITFFSNIAQVCIAIAGIIITSYIALKVAEFTSTHNERTLALQKATIAVQFQKEAIEQYDKAIRDAFAPIFKIIYDNEIPIVTNPPSDTDIKKMEPFITAINKLSANINSAYRMTVVEHSDLFKFAYTHTDVSEITHRLMDVPEHVFAQKIMEAESLIRDTSSFFYQIKKEMQKQMFSNLAI